MYQFHRELLDFIEEKAEKDKNQTQSKQYNNSNYTGSNKPTHGLKASVQKQIIKVWKQTHPDLTFDQFIKTLDSLFSEAQSATEIYIAGRLVQSIAKFRKKMDLNHLRMWLEHTNGWAEIDTLCQSSFTSQELLNNFDDWSKMLVEFSQSERISKRRASLVLLIKSLRHSRDQRLVDLAFANIDRLKAEDDILITKAISWILREMTKLHKEKVRAYLKDNEASLPRIAVRETWKKIRTGKKN